MVVKARCNITSLCEWDDNLLRARELTASVRRKVSSFPNEAIGPTVCPSE